MAGSDEPLGVSDVFAIKADADSDAKLIEAAREAVLPQPTIDHQLPWRNGRQVRVNAGADRPTTHGTDRLFCRN